MYRFALKSRVRLNNTSKSTGLKLLYTNKAHNSQAAKSVKENSSDDHVIIKLKVHGD